MSKKFVTEDEFIALILSHTKIPKFEKGENPIRITLVARVIGTQPGSDIGDCHAEFEGCVVKLNDTPWTSIKNQKTINAILIRINYIITTTLKTNSATLQSMGKLEISIHLNNGAEFIEIAEPFFS